MARCLTAYLAHLGLRLGCLLVMHQAATPTFTAPHTLSTTLNPRDARGRLSRLMATPSPGAFIAPPDGAAVPLGHAVPTILHERMHHIERFRDTFGL